MIRLPWIVRFVGLVQDNIERWKYDRHSEKTLKRLNKDKKIYHTDPCSWDNCKICKK